MKLFYYNLIMENNLRESKSIKKNVINYLAKSLLGVPLFIYLFSAQNNSNNVKQQLNQV